MYNYLTHYEKAVQLFSFDNDIEKAIKEYKKVIKLKPDYAEAYYDLGYIFQLNNNKRCAKKYYQIYLTLKPNAKDKEEIIGLISADYKYKN